MKKKLEHLVVPATLSAVVGVLCILGGLAMAHVVWLLSTSAPERHEWFEVLGASSGMLLLFGMGAACMARRRWALLLVGTLVVVVSIKKLVLSIVTDADPILLLGAVLGVLPLIAALYHRRSKKRLPDDIAPPRREWDPTLRHQGVDRV